MLKLIPKHVETSTTKLLQKRQFFSNLFQRGVPFVLSLLVGHEQLRRCFLDEPGWDQLPYEVVWYHADHYCHRYRKESQDHGVAPLSTIQSMCREGITADEDDHDLSPNNYELDADEEVIPLYAFEYVHLIVDASVVVLVEDLHPNEGIED